MFIDISGLTMHVQQEGPPGAPVLLMLHSLGTNLHVWDAQARAFAGHMRVLRMDLRGHGLSSVVLGPATIACLAGDVLHVLDALDIGRLHLAGLSIGGLVAQHIAARAPERAASLLLCNTARAIGTAQGWQDRARIVRSGGTRAVADDVMRRWTTAANADTPMARGLRAMLLTTPPEGYAAAAEAIGAAAHGTDPSSIDAPTLVLAGERDGATPPADAEALASSIPGAHLEIIPGAAHLAPAECPDAVTEAMAAFLAIQSGDMLERGFDTRRAVLGQAHVDKTIASTTPFDRDFQDHITRTAWGGIWSRPQLDWRTRSLLTLAVLATLGREEELALHLRATRNTGATKQDVAEMLLHVSIYAGVPAANAAIRLAKTVLADD